jgi:hypothetical protein
MRLTLKISLNILVLKVVISLLFEHLEGLLGQTKPPLIFDILLVVGLDRDFAF